MPRYNRDQVTLEVKERYEEELRRLSDVELPRVKQDLAIARSQGDLSENADYDAARNEQARIEQRIQELNELLNNIIVIDTSNKKTNKVSIGSTVTFYDYEDEVEYEYQIVGTVGGDPDKKQISSECALGSAIINKKVDEVATVNCEDGSSYQVKILSIK